MSVASGTGMWLSVKNRIASFLSRAYPYRAIHEHARKFTTLINEGGYSAIVVRYINTYIAIGSPSYRNLVIDFDDDPLEAYRSSALTSKHSILRRLRRNLIGRILKSHIDVARYRAAQIWVSNPEHIDKSTNYRLMPNAAPSVNILPELRRVPFQFIFVADMRYPPNIEALRYYCSHIHPKLIQQRDDAKLIVCGRFDPDMFKDKCFSQPGIIMAGFVPNISEIYSSCSAAIAPMVSGSGTSVKVMEAIAAGVPCVGTPLGFRGYVNDVKSTLPFLLASNADDFAEKMLFLGGLGEDELDISNSCRHFAMTHWSQDVVHKCIKDAVISMRTA